MGNKGVLEVSPQIYLIDVSPKEVGKRAIASYIIKYNSSAVIVEPGPYSTAEKLMSKLDVIGVKNVELLIPTHIHVDHYGSASYLIKHYKSALILVHPRGYRHVINPSYLWSSTRKYMGQLADIFMKPEPIDKDRVRVSYDGMALTFGNIEIFILHTPGHSPHHQSIMLSTGELLVGDSAGIYIHEHDVILPMAVPPFNLETYVKSIDHMLKYNPSRLLYTHFGVLDNAIGNLKNIKQKMMIWNDIIANKCKSGISVNDAIKIMVNSDSDLKTSFETVMKRPIYRYALKMSILGYLKYNNLI